MVKSIRQLQEPHGGVCIICRATAWYSSLSDSERQALVDRVHYWQPASATYHQPPVGCVTHSHPYLLEGRGRRRRSVGMAGGNMIIVMLSVYCQRWLPEALLISPIACVLRCSVSYNLRPCGDRRRRANAVSCVTIHVAAPVDCTVGITVPQFS